MKPASIFRKSPAFQVTMRSCTKAPGPFLTPMTASDLKRSEKSVSKNSSKLSNNVPPTSRRARRTNRLCENPSAAAAPAASYCGWARKPKRRLLTGVLICRGAGAAGGAGGGGGWSVAGSAASAGGAAGSLPTGGCAQVVLLEPINPATRTKTNGTAVLERNIESIALLQELLRDLLSGRRGADWSRASPGEVQRKCKAHRSAVVFARFVRPLGPEVVVISPFDAEPGGADEGVRIAGGGRRRVPGGAAGADGRDCWPFGRREIHAASPDQPDDRSDARLYPLSSG